MWTRIFQFELLYRRGRPATYLYFLILFIMCFAAIASENVQIGADSEKVYKNAPTVIYTFCGIMSAFGMLIASAVMGVPLYRDLEFKTDTFFFSFPIKEKDYLLGRFLGSYAILLFILSGIQIGILMGGIMPWVESDRIGPVNWAAHGQAFLLIVVPNSLFVASIFFSLVALTKRMMAAYSGSIILLVAYLISLQFLSDLDRKWIAELLDPFAINTIGEVTRYWSIGEQNTSLLPLSGNFLYNRLIWVLISILLLGTTFLRFSFSGFKIPGGKGGSSDDIPMKAGPIPEVSIGEVSFGDHFKQTLSLSWVELKNAITNPYFISILFAGSIFLFLDCFYTDELYGTPAMPLTYLMVSSKNGTFFLVVLIILIYYSGEMIYRERALKFSQILDALPIPNWMLYGSKLLAIFYICIMLASTVMLVGVLVQLIKGFTEFEFTLYFKDLYLVALPYYLIMATFVFFIMILVNNKFIGFGVVLAYWLSRIGLGLMDFDHNMLYVGDRPGYTYSNINGFGHYVEPLFWFTIYWMGFSLVLVGFGNLLWPRGIVAGFQDRVRLLKQRLNWKSATLIVIGLIVWVGSGSVIFYNTVILNEYKLGDTVEEERVAFEKEFKKYQGLDHPKIYDVKLDIELYPSERKADIQGVFQIFNPHKNAIDSLWLNFDNVEKTKSVTLSGNKLDKGFESELYDFRLIALDSPILPGDSLEMTFDITLSYEGFPNEVGVSTLNYNGTFFNTGVLPSFGYNEGLELSSDSKRKKHDLEPQKTSVPIDDPVKKYYSFLTDDADYVQFEVKVGTEKDQVAIVPGYLQKRWEENDRAYFHYKTDSPGFYFFSILSARYDVAEDSWTGKDGRKVKLEVYHHPGHDTNIDRLMKGMKNALQYYEDNFSPYQHRQLRILEFPRYSRFAQSFANTVPYSEDFGWVTDFTNPDDIDYAFYVTAHEVAHQWWGHQVMPRATNGASTVSETMSQYSALMVMEKEYGTDQISKFLKYELRSYLRGRSDENKYEPTLLNNEGQGYVHYRKGSLAMYWLKDLIGEDSLNAALQRYVDSVAFIEAPFTSSQELYDAILSVTPDSIRYVAEDLFERRVLYENRALESEYEKLKDKKYTVTLTINAQKMYQDSLGYDIEGAPMNDWVDIGVFGEVEINGSNEEVPLYFKKHRLKAGEHTIEVTVDQKPTKAGIDPYIKLVDRNPDDNKVVVSEKGSIL